MKKGLILMLSIFSTCLTSAQVTFEKNYYLDGYEPYNISPAIINTVDSGYYLISFSGDTDVTNNFIISISRLNKQGNVLWNKNSDAYTLHSDYGLGEIVQYPDSSLVMLWNNINSTHFDNKTGFVHIDKNGNAIWAKRYICPLNRGYIYMNSFIKT